MEILVLVPSGLHNLRNPFPPAIAKSETTAPSSLRFPCDPSRHAACSNGGMLLQPFADPDTYRIIGAAMAVHTELGCGFLESVYRAALRSEFDRNGVTHRYEVKLPISYKGQVLVELH